MLISCEKYVKQPIRWHEKADDRLRSLLPKIPGLLCGFSHRFQSEASYRSNLESYASRRVLRIILDSIRIMLAPHQGEKEMNQPTRRFHTAMCWAGEPVSLQTVYHCEYCEDLFC